MGKKNHKIGIVGGAGPMAGMLLMQKIVELCQKEHGCQHDADFPYIMLLSYPFADMLSDSITAEQQKEITAQLEGCFSTFSQHGIDIVAIACNTLHLFLTEAILEKKMQISFVHMLEECGKSLRSSGLPEGFVLCSNTSAKSKLHARYFPCRYPVSLQQKCQKMIDMVLAGKETAASTQQFAMELNHHLMPSHSPSKRPLILGCTEFSVLNERYTLHAHGLSEQFTIFDTNAMVAKEICRLVF